MLSVIIPAYNAEAFLGECFASLDAQSFRDFETVVVDDGSTDNTGALCDEWAMSRPHATVLHKDNEGLLLARRDALSAVRGEYVTFLDSDDALREDALLQVADAIADTGAELVAFGFSNNPDYSHPKFCSDFTFDAPVGQGGGLARRVALRGRFNSLWGKAFALATLDASVDYRRWKGLMHGEDLFQLLPILDEVERVVYLPEALYFYRHHRNNSTASYKPKQLDDITVVCERLLEYGGRWGMPDDAAYGALRNFCSLAKILLNDVSAREMRDSELSRMTGFLRGLGLDDKNLVSSQRFDNRLLLRAIISGRSNIAAAIVSTVEIVKQIEHIKCCNNNKKAKHNISL